jgi:hypothetical protein
MAEKNENSGKHKVISQPLRDQLPKLTPDIKKGMHDLLSRKEASK